MMKQLLRTLAVLSMATLLLAACGASATTGSVTPAGPTPTGIIIGYSAPGLVGAQLQIQQSLERHARDRGWRLVTTTSGGDPQRQNDQIGEFVALGVDAIVAVPDDSKAICAAVEQARAAGIPFYTIDRSTDGCSITMTVFADNYMAGRQSAEAILGFLSERHGEPRGSVLEITGNMAQDVAQLRGAGFHDALAAYPEIVITTMAGDWDGVKGGEAVRKALAWNEQIEAIYVHSDAVYFEAVIAALNEMGRLARRGDAGHIFLAGVDASPVGVQAIRDGLADQVSNQPIPDFGLVTDWIAKELRGEPIEEGEVVQEGALWSPATVKLSPTGARLFLSTTSVTHENVDHPGLWANQ